MGMDFVIHTLVNHNVVSSHKLSRQKADNYQLL